MFRIQTTHSVTGKTFSKGAKRPCLRGQVKYCSPWTDPSFLPSSYQSETSMEFVLGLSSSMPTQSPVANFVFPINRTVPNLQLDIQRNKVASCLCMLYLYRTPWPIDQWQVLLASDNDEYGNDTHGTLRREHIGQRSFNMIRSWLAMRWNSMSAFCDAMYVFIQKSLNRNIRKHRNLLFLQVMRCDRITTGSAPREVVLG